MKSILPNLIALSVIAALARADDVIYDSHGFESPAFSSGPLNGQGGWSAIGVGGGIEPLIAPSPTNIGERVLQFEIPNAPGSYSYAILPIADPLAAGYTKITVNFDVYRHANTTLLQELWWWWDSSAGSPWLGLQYDWDYDAGNPGVIAPFYDQGYMTVLRAQWTSVTMEWDFAAGTASSWYNGELVDDALPMGTPLSSLTSYTLYFQSGFYGAEADRAWVDNFVITAAPSGASCIPCDTNCDGSINQFDIQPFVNVLSGASGCSPCAADANADGSVNQFDIQGFVECLSNP